MKAIISVLGKDAKGIIAKVSTLLFEEGANIIDINQTVMQGFFTMTMLVEIEKDGAFKKIKDKLDGLALQNALDIRVQNEAVFDAMHRI